MATVEERIKQFNSNRLPVYTALKYGQMIKDPFVFFRGTCHLFYEDLNKYGTISPSPQSWICGDLHLENFGSYKGDNRLVYFDITDFDEGILSPTAFDLARIVTSIFVALEEGGSTQIEIIAIARLFLQSYSSILNKGKARYIEQQTATGITLEFLDKVCERKQKDLVGKRTIDINGRLKLKIDNDKLFALPEELKQTLADHLTLWIQNSEAFRHVYKVVDTGFRIAGTGSIGINRYLFLLKEEKEEKYLLIDMKQSGPSSLQPYSAVIQPVWVSDAERITAIQHRMQNIPPALLSTTIFNGNSYVLKEMQPSEDKIGFKMIRDNYEGPGSVIQDLALITSSAQLRSSGRQGSACADELIDFGGAGNWQEAILDYAIQYADQVKKDHKAFVKAYDAGFFTDL